MNNIKNYYVSVESVRNEIKKTIDENERFIRGRTDENELYAGEVVLTQLRRLLRKFDDYPVLSAIAKDKETPMPPGVAAAIYRGLKEIDSLHYYCPRCDKRLFQVRNGHYFNPKYCEICGQAIDWGKAVNL